MICYDLLLPAIDSMHGHIATMAKEVKAGIEEAGCECVMLQCPETLPAEALEKM